MLQVRNLHYSIGEQDLLVAVDWNLQPGKRFALVGPNGSGKTTLLRILKGEIESQAGVITKPRNYIIGYLPQEEIVEEVKAEEVVEEAEPVAEEPTAEETKEPEAVAEPEQAQEEIVEDVKAEAAAEEEAESAVEPAEEQESEEKP